MSKKAWIISAVIVVVLFVGSFFLYKYYFAKKVQANNERYAVFLSNDQVYFGYLVSQDKYYIVLSDIYYLKSNTADANSSPKVSLVKWGEEIHGPENQMQIVRDQVQYIAKMKPDSKINDAIKKFQSGIRE